jgi:hypothetical protein
MAIQDWVISQANEITNTTKIKDADNKLQASMTDLSYWINSTNGYETNGVKQEVNALVLDIESNILSQTSDFNTLTSNLQSEWDTTLNGWQVEFTDIKSDWQSQLQSVVDDTVITEW